MWVNAVLAVNLTRTGSTEPSDSTQVGNLWVKNIHQQSRKAPPLRPLSGITPNIVATGPLEYWNKHTDENETNESKGVSLSSSRKPPFPGNMAMSTNGIDSDGADIVYPAVVLKQLLNWNLLLGSAGRPGPWKSLNPEECRVPGLPNKASRRPTTPNTEECVQPYSLKLHAQKQPISNLLPRAHTSILRP